MTDDCHPDQMDAMGAADPAQPPWPVGEVLGTGRLPDDLVRYFSDWFRVTREEGGPLSVELRYKRGIHTFIGHLAYRVDPAPVMEHPAFLGVDWDRTVHILNFFFFVPVGR